MRITQNSLSRQVIASVQDSFNRMADIQQQMTSGLAIDQPSDDPFKAAQILGVTSASSRGEQYLSNIQTIMQDLNATSSAVGQISDLLARVKSDALSGSNGSTSATDRNAIATQVDQELNQLLQLANQKNGGRYLFGGAKTDAPPYDVTRDGSGEVTAGSTAAQGSDQPFALTVEDEERMDGSLPADDLFSLGAGDSIFQTLIDLRDALRANDTDSITATVDRLGEAVDQTASNSALIGARLSSAQTTQQRLQDAQAQSTQQLSNLADADVVDTISRYNQEQTAYQMALQSAARIIQPSLLDFL
jgi:flagellar hook-associated protein 3 FlgL